MLQNPPIENECACNDYFLLTARTSVVTVDIANPNLNGTGNVRPVKTGSGNGSIIRSVIIKATGPVTTGMVRLYVYGAAKGHQLYREVPIPTTPQLSATPVPAPVLLTFEVKLVGDLKLQSGDVLFASTQNQEEFNIIAEGLDWIYPESPTVCCNFEQEAASTQVAIISAANPYTNGSGTIVGIFQTGSVNGANIRSVTIKALQNTHEGAVRLFISPDEGVKWYLMQEVWIPETSQSAFEPSFKQVIDLDYHLGYKYIIGASTNNAESFAITIEGTDWSYPI